MHSKNNQVGISIGKFLEVIWRNSKLVILGDRSSRGIGIGIDKGSSFPDVGDFDPCADAFASLGGENPGAFPKAGPIFQ